MASLMISAERAALSEQLFTAVQCIAHEGRRMPVFDTARRLYGFI